MSYPGGAAVVSRRGRVDWRFLLPLSERAFAHLVLLGGTPELADRVIETGVARRVSAALPAGHDADAVVVLAGAAVPIAGLAHGLADGGALYYEVDRRRPHRWANSPRRVKQQLKRAGLTPTGIYWVAPDFTHCRRYIPLDVPEAMQWYLSAMYVAGSPLHRLAALGLRLAARVGAFAAVAPCYAVTAIAGAPRTPAAVAAPSFAKWWGGPGARPMVLTSGQDDGSRTVVLPFQPGRSQPGAVLKFSAHAHLNDNTEREQFILTEIRARLSPALQSSLPQPLGLQRLGALSVSIESCARGQALVVSSGRWPASLARQLADLRLVAGWLSDFQRQTQTGRACWDQAAYERWVEGPLTAYAEIFGLTPPEAGLFAQVRAHGRALLGASVAMGWMHYDLGPWNLYIHRGALTVIDWEFGRAWEHDRYGPGLYDLLYFVTYWYHIVRHLHTEAAELRGQHRLFVAPAAPDRHAAAARQVIAEHLAALNMDPRFVPVMLVGMWIEQALHRFVRRAALGEVVTKPRSGNRCVGYLGVLAAQADQFFATHAAASGAGLLERRLDR